MYSKWRTGYTEAAHETSKQNGRKEKEEMFENDNKNIDDSRKRKKTAKAVFVWAQFHRHDFYVIYCDKTVTSCLKALNSYPLLLSQSPLSQTFDAADWCNYFVVGKHKVLADVEWKYKMRQIISFMMKSENVYWYLIKFN